MTQSTSDLTDRRQHFDFRKNWVDHTDLPVSIAAVVPLFNKEEAIADTLRSVLHQSRPPDELIVVDDGSTDRSREVAEALLRASGQIPWKLISQSNAGVSVARNRGVAESESQFVAFLDGDDEWMAGHLAEIEKLAIQFPEAGVLSTHSVISSQGGSLMAEPTPLPRTFFGKIDRPLAVYRRGRGMMNSSSVALRRDVFDRVGGFPVGCHCGEDIFVWLKLGMSEQFAHSGNSLVIVHAEYSGNALRERMIGYQFSYFLGTESGRAELSHSDLLRFLSSHLVAQIVWRRVRGHTHVESELRALSRALPLTARLKSAVALNAPVALLRVAKFAQFALAKRTARPCVELPVATAIRS